MKSSEELNTTKSSFSIGLLGLYALLVCPFIIAYPKTDLAYYITRFLQMICVFVWGALQVKNGLRITLENKFFIYSIHAWWIFLIINTFLQVPIRQFTQIYYWITIWNIILIAKLYWNRDFTRHLYHIGVLFSFLVYLNTILFILFPHGLWMEEEWLGTGDKTRYLFGNYNQTGIVGLISLLVWGIYTLKTGTGKRNLNWLMICNICVVTAMGSMTSTVGILIICAYLLMYKRIKNPFRWIGIFFALYILFFIIIIWQGKTLANWPIFADFVVNVLHKNITFSSRIYLWRNAVKLIMASPIIGYGAQNVEWMVKEIGGSGPHNIWLMVLLEGGLVSFTILLGLFAKFFKQAKLCGNIIGTHTAVCLAVLLLMSLFETYYIICVFFIMVIAYYTLNIEVDKKKHLEHIESKEPIEDKAS